MGLWPVKNSSSALLGTILDELLVSTAALSRTE